MSRYDDAGGGTGAPYLGRHRKVPPQVRAASQLGRRLAAATRPARSAPGGALTPDSAAAPAADVDEPDEPR